MKNGNLKRSLHFHYDRNTTHAASSYERSGICFVVSNSPWNTFAARKFLQCSNGMPNSHFNDANAEEKIVFCIFFVIYSCCGMDWLQLHLGSKGERLWETAVNRFHIIIWLHIPPFKQKSFWILLIYANACRCKRFYSALKLGRNPLRDRRE